MPEAADQEAMQAAFHDDLANRTFAKMQVLHPTEFAHCLAEAKVEMLTAQLEQAHGMIEHLQEDRSDGPNRRAPAKKATARRTKTATTGKDKQ